MPLEPDAQGFMPDQLRISSKALLIIGPSPFRHTQHRAVRQAMVAWLPPNQLLLTEIGQDQESP
jgi:hypothetical protein